MEPLVAVFRVRNPETGQAKFGECWLKPHDKPLEKIATKKLLQEGEAIDGLWTIQWADPKAQYTLLIGKDDTPEIDVAANMRKRLLKGKKARLVEPKPKYDCGKPKYDSGWSKGVYDNSVKHSTGYVDRGIEPMGESEFCPYSIVYPSTEGELCEQS
jgi:hypothetical protein